MQESHFTFDRANVLLGWTYVRDYLFAVYLYNFVFLSSTMYAINLIFYLTNYFKNTVLNIDVRVTMKLLKVVKFWILSDFWA